MLARALATPSNLLVLDEPTNDLDLETLDLLQEMIADFPGTVLLVSHDRDFLDRTVTSVLAAEEQGSWVEYAGGYSDMLAQRGPAPALPQRQQQARPARPAPRRQALAPKRALSFRDKHALETLPARIESLHATAAALHEALADTAFFQRDPAAYSKAAGDLEVRQRELDLAEAEWLRLELLREEIEG